MSRPAGPLRHAPLIALMAAFWPPVALAGAQTFNTALPVAQGNWVFREQLLYKRVGDDGAADREIDVWGSISVLGYGVTGDLALFGVVPVLAKSLEVASAGRTGIERDTRGFGDARLLARYTVLHEDVPGRTFRVAPFIGIEAPTGRDDDRDRFGRLPPPLQAGSGSWDPLGGVVATWQTLAYEIDAQVSYKANTPANGFELGDLVRLDSSLQYRLWPRELGPGVPGFLYGVLEVNLLHQADNEIEGTKNPDSGRIQLFLSPGVQYVTKRWVLEGIAQVPVAEDRNDAALGADLAVRVGFRLNF